MLQAPGAWRFFYCLLIAFALMQVWKVGRFGIAAVLSFVLRASLGNLFKASFLAGVLLLFSRPIHDALQYAEQMYLNPIRINMAPDTVGGAIRVAYERELYKNTNPEEYKFVVEQTALMAVKYGTSSLEIYRVALSECGMNPFAFNVDRQTGRIQAAGWIQFTPGGLESVLLDGRKIAFQDVVSACYKRDIRFIMALTDAYFAACLNGRKMPRAVDVYCVVFCPSYIGHGAETVVYQGWSNPAYYKNAGFDGYRLVDGKAVRMDSWKDGRITLREIELHLLRKEKIFLS